MTAARGGGSLTIVLVHRPAGLRPCALAMLALVACSEANDSRPGDGEGDALRLGRVHVVLEPSEDAIAPEGREQSEEAIDSQLEVSARFAFVRGLDEEFVRARIDVPVLPQDALRPGECVPSSSLVLEAGEPEDHDARELVLVDAGDLTVTIGESAFEVPLALVPDLLPYMSGVEYMHEGDTMPIRSASTPDVVVVAQGSMSEDMPPFTAQGRVPAALELGATDADLQEQREGALVLRWTPQGDDVITVRLVPLVSGEAAGDEITCVLADRGTARIDLRQLAVLGLSRQVEAVRVTASRTSLVTFDVGEFTGTELVVERRDRLIVPNRRLSPGAAD